MFLKLKIIFLFVMLSFIKADKEEVEDYTAFDWQPQQIHIAFGGISSMQ